MEAKKKVRLSEFDWLKMVALLLLIFVHSYLYFDFPLIMNPVEWIMLSIFFFVSGYLAFSSLHRRGENPRHFLKSKILTLYVPFVVVVLLYFVIETAVKMPRAEPVSILTQVSFLNVFDVVNSGVYNWSFLWFVPYLLVFMLVFCVLETYIKSGKIQLLIVSVLWVGAILAWVYSSPLKLGLLFTQYFFVFMIGSWLNKAKMYDRIITAKTALVAVPFIVFFSLDLSAYFTLNNSVETLKYLLYFNGRTMMLGLSVVFLVLPFCA